MTICTTRNGWLCYLSMLEKETLEGKPTLKNDPVDFRGSITLSTAITSSRKFENIFEDVCSIGSRTKPFCLISVNLSKREQKCFKYTIVHIYVDSEIRVRVFEV